MIRRKKRQAEPTIALINIVFLMLIFFLVAGTMAQPLDSSMTLVRTADIAQAPPPDALVLDAQGQLLYRGDEVADVAGFVAAQAALQEDKEAEPTLRIVPDRDVAAERLIALGRTLKEAGAGRVMIVTERGLK